MIRKYLEHTPEISPSAYIDESATIIGKVCIGDEVSIWPQAVLRGDSASITLKRGCNVQDGAIIHGGHSTEIGEFVSIGHGAIVHGAKISDNVLVGMGSIVLDNAQIGKNCIIGAGALVTGGKVFEEGSLIIGSPAKAVRKLTAEEIASIEKNARVYLELKKDY